MKKLTALFTVLAILSLTLASCAPIHEHEWRGAWSSDLERHWHYCTASGCLERSGQEEHTWDAGVVAAAPTPTIAGLKKFTCTVCGAIRTEVYEYEGWQ